MKSKFIWHFCEGGKNLPEPYKGKVCIFKRGIRVELEVCTLVESLEEEGKFYWLVKGSASREPVYPIAWLEIVTNFDIGFFELLRLTERIEI